MTQQINCESKVLRNVWRSKSRFLSERLFWIATGSYATAGTSVYFSLGVYHRSPTPKLRTTQNRIKVSCFATLIRSFEDFT
jgi:hypothetical protein